MCKNSAIRFGKRLFLTTFYHPMIPSFTMHSSRRSLQQDFFEKISRSYGGDLLTRRKCRSHGRPISTRHSMHFVLRSTQAKGEWSFLRHRHAVKQIVEKFAAKNGVQLKSMANVGNHIHLHLQLANRHTYRAFIRAITSAIMMQTTGASRWNNKPLQKLRAANEKFWDRRPLSRIVVGFKAMLTMADYIAINALESQGVDRSQARFFVEGTG